MSSVICSNCANSLLDQAAKCPRCSYTSKHLVRAELNIEVVKKSSSMIWTGYGLAFLALLFFPIYFMLFGMIFGMFNITKNEVGHGVAQIILSLIFGILGLLA